MTNYQALQKAFMERGRANNLAQAMEAWLREYFGTHEIFRRWGHNGLQADIVVFIESIPPDSWAAHRMNAPRNGGQA